MQGYFVNNLVEFGLVVLERGILNFGNVFSLFLLSSLLENDVILYFYIRQFPLP